MVNSEILKRHGLWYNSGRLDTRSRPASHLSLCILVWLVQSREPKSDRTRCRKDAAAISARCDDLEFTLRKFNEKYTPLARPVRREDMVVIPCARH